MWVEALELLLGKMEADGFAFRSVAAVSGSGQQHGSVYWRRGMALPALRNLHPARTLSSQLQLAFSLMDSPVWMDSSTSSQCRAIEASPSVGGPSGLSLTTGSRAYERFTGPQIRKLYEQRQPVYDETERISLVSSFMASLLVGDYVSIDHSDGAGMNLMDLKQRVWSQTLLDVCLLTFCVARCMPFLSCCLLDVCPLYMWLLEVGLLYMFLLDVECRVVTCCSM
jgi:xylulokinase